MRRRFPRWSKMAEFDARQQSDGIDQAAAHWDEDRVVVSLGKRSFFLRSDAITDAPDLWDFALFGLAAISSYTNRTIRFDQPVSASGAKRIEQLNYAYKVWSLSSLSPPRLELTNIVPDPDWGPKPAYKLHCLSGGIDSTASIIAAQADAEYTHALLIAGADYPSVDHSGFRELRERVGTNAKHLGLELITFETNFRTMPIDWELQHSFLLAMALHYHAPNFSEGSYALDFVPVQEIMQHPWGNCGALMDLFSTPSLPIQVYGKHLSRWERAQVIAAHNPALLQNLSVCWVDTSTGANCGRCNKCQRARAIFENIGISTEDMFVTHGDLQSASLKVPSDYGVRMSITVYASWADFLRSDDPQRAILDAHVQQLRRAYVRQMPYR